jgi:hypothetical protein
MSWVEDARKLLQGFVAPELRAISARLDEAGKMVAERHAVLLDSNQERDKIATERHAALLDKLEAARREIMLQVELAVTKGRLQELESRQSEAGSAGWTSAFSA